MITVQATENVDDLVNGGGVVVIIKDIPDALSGTCLGEPEADVPDQIAREEVNGALADFIATEAGHARRRFVGEFAPAVAVQIIQ
jgi:hypothetical protein